MEHLIRLAPKALAVLFLATLSVAANGQATVDARSPYGEVARELERLLSREIQDKKLPALSIALVDDQHVVWARGFGFADPRRKIAATAETVYRVGSVSKLFTDIAVMQLVEQGRLDLDAPITTYLPEFSPKNPFRNAITLRQMMSHRSGLVRETPVGHYFDPTGPSLADTVNSLNTTTLVYAPETRTKYSNAAIAVVGYIVERVQNEPFSRMIQKRVLAPLGCMRSGFELTAELTQNLAKADMWTYDGRVFEAPTFRLGTSPAGNLYSTVNDLGRFLSMLFADGRGSGGQILKPETLQKMYAPQFVKEGEPAAFGLGFQLGELDGKRRVGHGGAVYGFSTEVAALPDEKLGVAVIASKDCANGVTRRVANLALKSMLGARKGQTLPTFEQTRDVAPREAKQLAGRYEHDATGFELEARGGKLFATATHGGYRNELRRLGEELLPDDCLLFGESRIRPEADRLLIGKTAFDRRSQRRPEPATERWMGLIGEYGWDHDVLYIFEKDGRLFALIEWFEFNPLDEVSPDVFAFPKKGLYDGEQLIFERGRDGRARQVTAASVVFKRRAIDGEDGRTFRITPLRPVAELRTEALAARAPVETGDFREPDLVELSKLDPAIKLDIRYATDNNFLGVPLYTTPRAFLQRPAAEALLRAHRALRADGYGLLIHDAYRPWHVTKMFWEATPEASRNFVADPAKGSKHNRGAAVDLTLYDLATGSPVPMVGGYDEFSERSNPDYPGGTSLQRWHRDLLRRAMEEQGFTVNEYEWWHFDFKDWSAYPILNAPLESLGGRHTR
jgi:CubicO group peptidase (beta-lactamase class C family)/D-alanyl-D-alanine dipeptidase